MYAVMGITGRVGGATAESLLAQGKSVRAIVRDKAAAKTWIDRGAETVVADSGDVDALSAAFANVDGVFVMIPGNFTPAKDFPETRAIVAALGSALAKAKPPKAVYLSSVGGHQTRGLGLITQLHILEQELRTLPIPNAFLRPAWFMENSQWDVAPAKEKGEVPAFLQPVSRRIPMVATDDIGRTAANVLQQSWTGNRVIEIEGPRRYSPSDIAEAFASLLGRAVRAVAVPREQWAALFESQGTPPDRTAVRIEMLDGFNSGWIDFEQTATEHVTGRRSMPDVLKKFL
jgi:NAD(P)H dehydrogenase (quinone)